MIQQKVQGEEMQTQKQIRIVIRLKKLRSIFWVNIYLFN